VTLAPATPVTQAARSEIAARIGSLETGGCTNLGDGWLKGCECLGNALIEKGINRALLLSDGLANRGITDLEELGQHARGLRDRGISTSTFGIGLDFNEHLLEHMSNQGGGNFYYIQSPYMIPEIFMQEFNELAAVTARDVEINLKIPAHVASQVLGSWKHELVQDELTILVGDMASNQKRELYVRLLCPQYENLAQLTLVGTAKCKGENSQVYEISAELVFRYVDNEAQRNAPLNQGVMERYSLVEVADVATQALKLERQGEYGKANQLLQQSIGEHEAYLPAGKVEYYQELASRAKTGLSEPDRKSSHYVAYSEKKTR